MNDPCGAARFPHLPRVFSRDRWNKLLFDFGNVPPQPIPLRKAKIVVILATSEPT